MKIVAPGVGPQAKWRTRTSSYKSWPAEGVNSPGLPAPDSYICANQTMTCEAFQ